MLVKNSVLLLKAESNEGIEDKYYSVLKDNHYSVRQVKTLEFRYTNLDLFETKLNNPGDYSGIIFCSPRCVNATKLSIRENELGSNWNEKCNFVIGEATYQAVYNDLKLSCSGKECGNLENLSEYIIKDKTKHIKPFLFPHGNLSSDLPKTKLINANILLDEILVYETLVNPKLKDELDAETNSFESVPEYVVFFSPSGVRNTIKYFDNNSMEIKFVAIGPTTQKVMQDMRIKVHGSAKKPTPEDLLNVLK